MDYLDNKKQLEERILLFTGYILVAVAIVIAALILLYQAYGFNLGKNGAVIQEGLVFFSSQPNPASIYINGTLNPSQTNARVFLPSGIYQIKLTRSGYRDWTRTITVDGGAVEHFDYPVLFPLKLASIKLQDYDSAPGLVTSSPDRRWILVEKPGSITDFDLYDMKDPKKPLPSTLSVPDGILTKATNSEGWQLVAWADDNQHILLQHKFDGKTEFILLDTADVTQTVNLDNTLNLGPSATLSLVNNKYNAYYVLNTSNGDLSLATLSTNTLSPVLHHVIAYKSYGDNTLLYVTSDGATKGKVLVKLYDGTNTYIIRALSDGSSNYLVNLTTYNGVLYVAAGSTNDNRVYIYQDPITQLTNFPNQGLAPVWVLHVPQPNYMSFSDNAQYIIAENGSNYAVYDIENNLGYLYSNPGVPVDSPQPHVSWMDGNRLTYVSQGKIIVADFDNKNMQTLVSASSNYIPGFSTNYRYMFSMKPLPTGQYELQETPLLTPPDL